MNSLRMLHLRALIAIVLAGTAAVALATTTVAKMPYFTIETSPVDPRPDEPILIAVLLWADPAHSVPGGSDDWTRSFAASETRLDDLIVARRPGAADVPVVLTQVSPNRYEGTLRLPGGEWSLVAFPDRAGWTSAQVPVGYPDAVPLVVRDDIGLPTVLLTVVGGFVGLLGLLVLRSRRAPGRSAPRAAQSA